MEPDLTHMPGYVQERWPLAVERAQRKVRAVKPDPAASQLVKAAQGASTAPQRIVWLHRAATAWAKPLQAVAACRKGCSHCCHTPVTISSIEADLIGHATGRKPVKPANAKRLQDYPDLEAAMATLGALSERRQGQPCPFLMGGACSVYEVRPMACRLLLNLDDDDLLCRLVPGHAVPVPYANAQQLQRLYVLAQPATTLADIRDFFPADRPAPSAV